MREWFSAVPLGLKLVFEPLDITWMNARLIQRCAYLCIHETLMSSTFGFYVVSPESDRAPGSDEAGLLAPYAA